MSHLFANPRVVVEKGEAQGTVRKEGEESEGHDARPDVGIYAILQTGEKRLGLSRRSTRPAEQTVKWRMNCLGGYKLSSRKRKPVIGAANLQRSDWETGLIISTPSAGAARPKELLFARAWTAMLGVSIKHPLSCMADLARVHGGSECPDPTCTETSTVKYDEAPWPVSSHVVSSRWELTDRSGPKADDGSPWSLILSPSGHGVM